MIKGYQTWEFESRPSIIGSSAVGGPFEAQGNIADDFDFLHQDIWLGQDSCEKAERKLLEEACEIAIKKSGVEKQDMQLFLSGDLMNQIISSSFTARAMGIPFMGIYGACSSSMEGLALASSLVDSKFAKNVLIATSSHNSASEKQYRYPTEYGAQKPPTAQWTVTGAGAAVISCMGNGPKVTSATIGKVVDMGLSDPYNMGAAMAPAAVDTIIAHFKDRGIDKNYYDVIATGDLGNVGFNIALDLLKEKDEKIPSNKMTDCGILIYKKSQSVMSGGSGCACAAVTTFGHFINMFKKGKLKRILIVATGALLSPISYQQKESIPCIAHAVSIEE